MIPRKASPDNPVSGLAHPIAVCLTSRTQCLLAVMPRGTGCLAVDLKSKGAASRFSTPFSSISDRRRLVLSLRTMLERLRAHTTRLPPARPPTAWSRGCTQAYQCLIGIGSFPSLGLGYKIAKGRFFLCLCLANSSPNCAPHVRSARFLSFSRAMR